MARQSLLVMALFVAAKLVGLLRDRAIAHQFGASAELDAYFAAFAIPDLIRTKVNLLPEGIEEVRVVEIEGLDLQADGGTHVANTREVGPLRIVDYKSKGSANKRLVLALQE